MRRAIGAAVVVTSVVTLAGLVHGQPTSAADQIRQRIAEFDRGTGTDRSAWLTKDAVI